MEFEAEEFGGSMLHFLESSFRSCVDRGGMYVGAGDGVGVSIASVLGVFSHGIWWGVGFCFIGWGGIYGFI